MRRSKPLRRSRWDRRSVPRTVRCSICRGANSHELPLNANPFCVWLCAEGRPAMHGLRRPRRASARRQRRGGSAGGGGGGGGGAGGGIFVHGRIVSFSY